MAEPNSSGTSINFSVALDTTYLKDGEFTLIIPISENITALIGHIVIQWGAFELRMDSAIQAIFPRLNKPEVPGWKRSSFRSRKKLFRDLMAEYTALMFPQERETFRSIAAKSGDLHWRRNIVAHGYVQTRSKPNAASETGHEPYFVATGQHKGRDVFIPLDEPTLQKLRYDIAHLSGGLMAAINRMGGRLASEAAPELIVADRDFLQVDQSGNFRFLAMQETPESAESK